MQPLAITAFSVVNSLGAGADAIVAALRERRSGLGPCSFETVVLNTYVGEVPNLDAVRMRPDLAAYDCRNNRLAQLGLELDGFADTVRALSAARGSDRVGVFMGTSTSGILQTELAYRHRDPLNGSLPNEYRYRETHNSFSLADFVQRYFGLTGPCVVVSTACSSSAKVFGNASRMIEAGFCDAAIVGGVDTLCLTSLYGFNSLGLVSTRPCRPFDAERDGISIGEGAGFVLLEKTQATAAMRARLLGIGESCDAYHMSTPHPEGAGARLAIERALQSAGLSAPDIQYVNMHGTASKTNDAAEDRAVFDVFGDQVPCSSTKGLTGHLLGAAGVTEALIALLALQHGLLPANANTQAFDPALRCRYLLENESGAVERVLSNSFGFGGSNCSLVLGAAA